MKQRIGLLAFLAVLGTPLIGCASPRVNLWPIYFQETRKSSTAPDRPVTSIEILYPFIAIELDGNRHYHALRPLYNYESNEVERSHRLQYLWPLGLQAGKEGDRWIHRLWPLFQHSKIARRQSGEEVAHGFLFPLIFWGRRPPEGSYVALFPLGGVTHGLLGDTFSFVLFPVYSYYRYHEYVRHNILWPFFSTGGTPDGKRELLRLWPLYVHRRQTDTYDHHYLLWPFLRWGSQQWRTRDDQYVRRYFAFHPFYSIWTTRDSDGKAVAYQRHTLSFTRRVDTRERTKEKSWSLLWSLIRRGSSPQKHEFRIFPFYWQTAQYPRWARDSGQRRTRFRILWPFIWLDVNTMREDAKDTNFLVVPFYWHYTRHYTDGQYEGRTRRSVTLWPLMTLQKEPDRSSHFWIASHGWKDATGGYKRNYRPFFDFFQYHRHPEGEKEIRILWRLFHHKCGPSGTYASLPLLFTYDSIGDEGADGEKSCSFLFDLIKYCWSEKGRRWRLLYIPL